MPFPVHHDFLAAAEEALGRRLPDDLVSETGSAREWPAFPADAISVAENGTGHRIILTSDNH